MGKENAQVGIMEQIGDIDNLKKTDLVCEASIKNCPSSYNEGHTCKSNYKLGRSENSPSFSESVRLWKSSGGNDILDKIIPKLK